MKKLLLIIAVLCLSVPALAVNVIMLYPTAEAPPAGCSQGDDSASDLCADETDGIFLDDTGTDAHGFTFTKSGSNEVWGIILSVKSYDDQSGGNMEVRIGTSADLSTYLAHATVEVITSGGAYITPDIQWTDSGGNPICLSLTDTTTYYVAMKVTANDVWIAYHAATSGTCSNAQRYTGSGWDLTGGSDAYDVWFKLIEGV